ncbi:unnamed protein product [Rotaria sp. Silwood1]|nr:unnamed protein product [Rotaria sp. Silwood1]
MLLGGIILAVLLTLWLTSTSTGSASILSSINLRWNQTGVIVAGDGARGSVANQFTDPAWIYIDANDTLYVADHHNYRIQKWVSGATAGVTVVNVSSTGDHPESITFDKNGFLYITGHSNERVVRYSPDFTSNTNVAGILGSGTSALTNLKYPLGLDLDDELNLYVAERGNRRVTKLTPNATSDIIVIGTSSTPEFYGLLLSLYSSTEAYVSSEDTDTVYLWAFNATTPKVSLTQVTNTSTMLRNPRGLNYDVYGNLYVADKGNKRVMMYCVNSTIGKVVVATTIAPLLDSPEHISFDSNMNLYVVDSSNDFVVKFERL